MKDYKIRGKTSENIYQPKHFFHRFPKKPIEEADGDILPPEE